MARKKQKNRTIFVLDASITLAWFFEDEADPYADEVQGSLAEAEAAVPSLWHLEVTNAVLVGERKKRTTEAKTTEFVSLLSSLPITVDEQTGARAFKDTLKLARAQNLSAYDAAYLELAKRRDFPLASLDQQLRTAAKAVGVKLYAPGSA
jgi:predicted nucleic acid-binding protein